MRNSALNGRWSFKWERCRDCGLTTRKHAAHGLCNCCIQYHRKHGTLGDYRGKRKAA